MRKRVGGLLALVAVMTAGRAWADPTRAGERRAGRPAGRQRERDLNPGRACCEIMGAAISGNGGSSPSSRAPTTSSWRDANGNEVDVFVRDRKLGLTELVSLGTGGRAGPDTLQRLPGDLARRAVRRLLLRSRQPRPERHQPHPRHLRARPEAGHDRDRQPGARRGPGRGLLRQRRAGDLRRRALRRLLVGRHQPGPARHQRPDGRLRPRPHDGHERPRERRAGRRPGQRRRSAAVRRRSRRDGHFVAFASAATTS